MLLKEYYIFMLHTSRSTQGAMDKALSKEIMTKT